MNNLSDFIVRSGGDLVQHDVYDGRLGYVNVTYTVPAKANYLWLFGSAGGGGGGGGSYYSRDSWATGGGGGRGAYTVEPVTFPVVPGAQYTVRVNVMQPAVAGILTGGGQALDGKTGHGVTFGNFFSLNGGYGGDGGYAPAVNGSSPQPEGGTGGAEGTMIIRAPQQTLGPWFRAPPARVDVGGWGSDDNHDNRNSYPASDVGFFVAGKPRLVQCGGVGSASYFGNGGLPGGQTSTSSVHVGSTDATGWGAGGAGGGAPRDYNFGNYFEDGDEAGSRGSPGFLIVRAFR